MALFVAIVFNFRFKIKCQMVVYIFFTQSMKLLKVTIKIITNICVGKNENSNL